MISVPFTSLLAVYFLVGGEWIFGQRGLEWCNKNASWNGSCRFLIFASILRHYSRVALSLSKLYLKSCHLAWGIHYDHELTSAMLLLLLHKFYYIFLRLDFLKWTVSDCRYRKWNGKISSGFSWGALWSI